MAAGLTVSGGTVPELREFLCRELADERAEAAAADAVEIDAVLTPRSATRPLVNEFERMQPFGPGNVEPLFALADVRIDEPIPMRGDHIRCQLTDASGARLRAIAWRAGDSELGRRLAAGGQLHVAGKLKPDDWKWPQQGQLEIEDAADPRAGGWIKHSCCALRAADKADAVPSRTWRQVPSSISWDTRFSFWEERVRLR